MIELLVSGEERRKSISGLFSCFPSSVFPLSPPKSLLKKFVRRVPIVNKVSQLSNVRSPIHQHPSNPFYHHKLQIPHRQYYLKYPKPFHYPYNPLIRKKYGSVFLLHSHLHYAFRLPENIFQIVEVNLLDSFNRNDQINLFSFKM